ncbi:MAG: hypothetical protein QOG48_1666 [Verrucomicrobiota bacterium]|jgi:hypothetical protein
MKIRKRKPHKAPNEEARIDLDSARNRLLVTWLSGAFAVLILVVIQSIIGRFEGFAQEFWGWFTPTIFPTLGLMLGVIGSTASEDDEGRTVKKFFFLAAVLLSIGYLILLLLTLLLEPLAGTHDMKYYNLANYWLAPIQALVVAAVGALFNSRKKTR